MVAAHALAATHIAVFVVVELLPLVRNVRSAHVATGVGNVLGNKGGVAVALSLGQELRRAWDTERRQLLETGCWAIPTTAEDDGPGLVSKRVWVHGWGEGQVQAFKSNPTGPSSHVIAFADLRRVETLKLDRKGNGQTPWLIHSGRVGTPVARAKQGKGRVHAGAEESRPVSLLFICSHLAAHQTHVAQRNASFHTIDNKMPLHPGPSNTPPLPGDAGNQPPPARASDRFDCSIWLGDLNYRIEANRQVVDTLLAKGDRSQALQILHANDQLTRVKDRGEAFVGWKEGPLNFAPTYKFDPGTDVYDSSSKRRIPAWTDRILHKCQHADDALHEQHNRTSSGLSLLSYNSVGNLRVSDHRPVRAAYVLHLPAQLDALVCRAFEAAGVQPGNPGGQRATQVCTVC